MKLGIIGTGKIVREFLPALRQVDGLELTAIQSTPRSIETARELCRTHDIPLATDDFEALCAAGVDTVYVAVPNALHYEYCKKALDAGLHVIAEKPMTSTYEEAAALAAHAKKKNLFLFEAVTTLYFPAYQKIKEWLPEIGAVKIVQSQYSQYSSRYDAFQRGEVLPAFDPKQAGGALMDLNLYNLHYVMGLFGKPTDAHYYANIDRGIDTSGVLIMQYDGFTAVCMAAKDCTGMSGGIIQGTKGCIRSSEAPNMVGTVTLERHDGTTETYTAPAAPARVVPEFVRFVQAVDAGDYAFCYAQLERSLAVCEVQTRARRQAGIRFPSDEAVL